MLHISDIEKRLTDNPEPRFIQELRMKIQNEFDNLEFQEGPHKYFVHNTDGTQYELPSVSHITHNFQTQVDWDENCKRTAFKRGMDYADLKRQWRETNLTATSNGTKTHLFGEACMYFVMGRVDLIPEDIKKWQYEDGFLIPYGPKERAIMRFYEDMIQVSTIYPVMPETKVYTKSVCGLSHPYAGTFDMLFAFKTKSGEFKLAIFDWKTNANLYNEFNQSKGNTLIKPFDYLIDEPKSMYTLQLSAYQIPIETLGVEVIDRRIVWLKSDETYEKIPVNDVTMDLLNALK